MHDNFMKTKQSWADGARICRTQSYFMVEPDFAILIF